MSLRQVSTDYRKKAGKAFTPAQRAAVFWSRVDKKGAGGCWIYLGCKDSWGYGRISVAGGRLQQSNRFSYELANGPIPAGLLVLHSCDVPACVNPAHLSLGTNSDNRQDSMRKGRHAVGERTRSAKMTDETARKIKAEYRKTGPRSGNGREVAARYGVSPSTVHAIGRGHIWKHIK